MPITLDDLIAAEDDKRILGELPGDEIASLFGPVFTELAIEALTPLREAMAALLEMKASEFVKRRAEQPNFAQFIIQAQADVDLVRSTLNIKNDAVFDDVPLDQIFADARVMRDMRQRYSLPLVKKQHWQSKPGPKENPEAMQALVEQWRDWRKRGFTQQQLTDFNGWKSRTPLTKAIRWHRNEFGEDSI